MTWKDISLGQFAEILKIESQNLDEIDNAAETIKVVFNEPDPLNLPIDKFQKYVNELKFLSNHVDDTRLVTQFTLNGRKYLFNGNTFNMSAGQFFDWRQYTKKDPIDYAECLSVFLIPEGHKYNDGYDMDQTISDINCIAVTDAMAMFSFFVDGLQMSSNVLVDYLSKQMKGLKDLEPEKKENLIKLIELYKKAADLGMTSSLSSSLIAKSQMKV